MTEENKNNNVDVQNPEMIITPPPEAQPSTTQQPLRVQATAELKATSTQPQVQQTVAPQQPEDDDDDCDDDVDVDEIEDDDDQQTDAEQTEEQRKAAEKARRDATIDALIDTAQDENITAADIEARLAERNQHLQQQQKTLKTYSMAEAFGLAKKYELDNKFSCKYGRPNIETNWLHFMRETQINMRPFVTFYTDKGKKTTRFPHKDAYGLYGGWANITLVSGDEIIQTSVSAGSTPHVWRMLLEHCA